MKNDHHIHAFIRTCYDLLLLLHQYSKADTTDACQPCTNKPDDSAYVSDPEEQCAYDCDPGYQGGDCLSPFDFFVSSIGGEGVFYSVVVCVG
jgi:hypothetical protein